jgi:peptidoglycan hydrolase-like protein with peptidoglycan-binding domain
MVQPKYSPEEALQRIKLMMEYDMSKTSTENKKVVSEQTTNLTADDLRNGKGLVKLGMKGDIVGKIQELLISKGYKDISKDGKVDNSFGGRTKKMVEKFQSANGVRRLSSTL